LIKTILYCILFLSLLTFFFSFYQHSTVYPFSFFYHRQNLKTHYTKKKLLEIKIELFQSYINLSTIKKKTYIIVNFKIHKINQDTRKLIRTFTLKKLKKLNYFISSASPHAYTKSQTKSSPRFQRHHNLQMHRKSDEFVVKAR
jgi:hypothetical protein